MNTRTYDEPELQRAVERIAKDACCAKCFPDICTAKSVDMTRRRLIAHATGLYMSVPVKYACGDDDWLSVDLGTVRIAPVGRLPASEKMPARAKPYAAENRVRDILGYWR